MDYTIKKEILNLESETKLLQKLIFIRKIILSSGAYSTHNMEVQNNNFERLNVPDWERQIIFDSWNTSKDFAHILLKKLDIISKKMEKKINDGGLIENDEK